MARAAFKNEADLLAAIASYLESDIIAEAKKMPTKAGLCLALGISRDTYSEYRKKYPDAIKAADMQIEDAWNQRLAGPNATGAIFYLKAALGYHDKSEVDVTSGGKPLTPMLHVLHNKGDQESRSAS